MDSVIAVVINGVVLGRRFLILDCFVFVYKDVHVLRVRCFIACIRKCCDVQCCRCMEVCERFGTSGMILGVVEVISIARVHCCVGWIG